MVASVSYCGTYKSIRCKLYLAIFLPSPFLGRVVLITAALTQKRAVDSFAPLPPVSDIAGLADSPAAFLDSGRGHPPGVAVVCLAQIRRAKCRPQQRKT